jgi:hypothetical protein
MAGGAAWAGGTPKIEPSRAAQWCLPQYVEIDQYGCFATSKRGELAEDENVPSVMMVTSAQRGGRYGC